MSKKFLKCVAISDTHNQHNNIELPEADVLIHSGDATYNGTEEEMTKFASWFCNQPYNYKIFVPGNHDFFCQRHPIVAEKMFRPNGVRYLVDTGTNIQGINFYGTPWVPNLPSWAYSLMDEGPGLEEKFIDGIPRWTDVLITHGPSWGKLDKVPRFGWVPGGAGRSICGELSVGSRTLAKAIEGLPHLKYHVFGHIHECHGVSYGYEQKPTLINAAICDRNYDTTNKPISFDIELPVNENESDESDEA